jgi:serine/threonine protein kinase
MNVGETRSPETRSRPAPLEGLGEYCVRRGFTTAERVRECLRRQQELEREGRPAPRLGELLVARGYLTRTQVIEALTGQNQEIRYCPRCRIQVNVSVRPDAVAYSCTRCRSPLTLPPDIASLSAEEDAALVQTPEKLPSDVERARRHPEFLFGKYILVRELGRGGAGVIYLAWDSYLSQYVALKLIRPEDADADDVAGRARQLVREARHAIRLRHPGIVTIYDVGRVGRDTYISMEYLEGETLDRVMERARNLGLRSPYFENPRRTLELLAEVADAIHYAHTRPSPIVHCDLKPGNVLIDPAGHAHVLDFGLARNLSQERPANGEIAGTPSYMSPEQACGISDQIDHRSDIYSFGAILYEVLCGRPTFSGDPLRVLQSTVEEKPDSPSAVLNLRGILDRKLRFGIPPELETLCMRCLSKNPEQRPESLREVADQLRRAVPAPETARATPSTPRSRRTWIPAGIAVAAAAALAVGLQLRTAPSAAPDPRPEIEARLARLDVESAVALARQEGDASAVEQASQIRSFLDRLAGELRSRKPTLEEFRFRESTRRPARIEHAGLGGIVVDGTSYAWKDVEPSQMLGLARICGLDRAPETRVGMARYARLAGRPSDATELLR